MPGLARTLARKAQKSRAGMWPLAAESEIMLSNRTSFFKATWLQKQEDTRASPI
jgi:hypothetical protein